MTRPCQRLLSSASQQGKPGLNGCCYSFQDFSVKTTPNLEVRRRSPNSSYFFTFSLLPALRCRTAPVRDGHNEEKGDFSLGEGVAGILWQSKGSPTQIHRASTSCPFSSDSSEHSRKWDTCRSRPGTEGEPGPALGTSCFLLQRSELNRCIVCMIESCWLAIWP